MLWITMDIRKAMVNLAEFGLSTYGRNGKKVYCQKNNDKALRLTHEGSPLGFVENPTTGERIGMCPSRMEYDEHYFGFGEQYSPVDKKMQEVDMFTTDPLSVGSPRTYVSLPFYLGTRGYGMYVNTHYRSKFFMGNHSNRYASCHIYSESLIDIFYTYGEEPKTIPERYTDITGKSLMTPKWSFGFWMSRCSYKTGNEVLEVAREMREGDLPCDVINTDTDWLEIPWVYGWKFGKHNSPYPEEMVKELDPMGIELSPWQKPYVTSECLPESRDQPREKGWILLNPYGENARSSPVVDLSNPDYCRWYKERLKNLLQMGVSAIKTDMGEGVPVEGKYHGHDGDKIRSIYPYLYSRVVYEASRESIAEPISWGRSTYVGGQKHPIHWTEDPSTDFDGLRFSIRSGLSVGMSGFTFWSHDAGGFLGRPSEEVYIRWMQAGMFCSHARCYGVNNPREPWTLGERMETIFRKFGKLRYELIPYIYLTTYTRGKQGPPVMGHLYLSNLDDRNCPSVEDEWMFGDALLVAPVLNEGGEREVYYPDGQWYHYLPEEMKQGKQYDAVKVELDNMPLYVKAGSIAPTNKAEDHIIGADDALTVCVYGKESGYTEFLYYNGEKHLIKAAFNMGSVQVETGDLKGNIPVKLITSRGVEIKTDVREHCIFEV